jgi:hypothetical protein
MGCGVIGLAEIRNWANLFRGSALVSNWAFLLMVNCLKGSAMMRQTIVA